MTRSLALAITAMLTANAFCARTATAEVPMAKAIDAAQSAVGACRANGYNVTATVLDSDFSTPVVLRGDGAPARFDAPVSNASVTSFAGSADWDGIDAPTFQRIVGANTLGSLQTIRGGGRRNKYNLKAGCASR
jgi:uncharacterized protein GlcG (DUF336 family)